MVGAGRIVVAGSGPGSVATVGKCREAPPAPDVGPHLAGRIFVASKYKDGVYCGSADRVHIERTQTTSTVPAEMLAATVERAAIKLANLVPLTMIPGAWAPDPAICPALRCGSSSLR